MENNPFDEAVADYAGLISAATLAKATATTATSKQLGARGNNNREGRKKTSWMDEDEDDGGGGGPDDSDDSGFQPMLTAIKQLRIFAATFLLHFILQVIYLSTYHSTYDGSWYTGDSFHFMLLFELAWGPLFSVVSITVTFMVFTRRADTNSLLNRYMVYTWACASIAAAVMLISFVFTSTSPTCSTDMNRACSCEDTKERCILFMGRQVRWTWLLTLVYRSANTFTLILLSFSSKMLAEFNEEIRSLWDRLEISTKKTRKHAKASGEYNNNNNVNMGADDALSFALGKQQQRYPDKYSDSASVDDTSMAVVDVSRKQQRKNVKASSFRDSGFM